MNATQSIELYTILFYVSMTVAIVGLVAAVGLFFLLDIPTVFALMTGRARRKTIERIAHSSNSGQLRKREDAQRMLDQTKATSDNLKRGRGADTPTERQSASPGEQETELLREDEQSMTLLKTAIGQETAERAAQDDADDGLTTKLSKQPVKLGKFELTETTVLIHTDESI